MRPLIEVMSEAMHDLGDWNPQESAEYVEGRLRAAGCRITEAGRAALRESGDA